MESKNFIFKCRQRIQWQRKNKVQLPKGSTVLIFYTGKCDTPSTLEREEIREPREGREIIHFNVIL